MNVPKLHKSRGLQRPRSLNAASQSRNLRWLGKRLSGRIHAIKLLVIGCGGNGQLIASMVGHLGARRMILCDGDKIDFSNLERYPYALSSDVGHYKAFVLAKYLSKKFPKMRVQAIHRHFPATTIMRHIVPGTMILGCTDSILSRIEIDLIARKRRCTYVDLGTGFSVDARTGMPLTAGGQILISQPQGACIKCLGFSLRGSKNTYFLPVAGRIDPSSILLNNIIASLASDCILSILSGPLSFNRLSYDANSFKIVTEMINSSYSCSICGTQGIKDIRYTASHSTYFTSLQ